MSTPAPKRVVLGVTAGIAAYKAIELCRRLVDAGLYVSPVLTRDAHQFVGALSFTALASEPVQTELFGGSSPIPHTNLGQHADLVVVAPATADFLARYATGQSNDLLTATLLATRAPVLVCPAMHTEMWEHPAVIENLATLRRRGVEVLEPAAGRLAGGDVGMGRLADPEIICARVLALLGEADLKGVRVLVTAGGTREPIDPVRIITNRSSGKQGHALAQAAAERGADVTLVTTANLPAPGVNVVEVATAKEMFDAVIGHDADMVIMAAAVADFRPKQAAARKLAKADGTPDIELEPTEDILLTLCQRRRPGQVIVGFAAETHDAVDRGRAKLARKGADLLVVNDVAQPEIGFDHDTNAVTILGADGSVAEVLLSSKRAVADAVLDRALAWRARSSS